MLAFLGRYAIPDEPAILQALSAVRAMREDPALFGFEVVISGEKITKTVCNLVALAQRSARVLRMIRRALSTRLVEWSQMLRQVRNVAG